jgi:hypothetical protein
MTMKNTLKLIAITLFVSLYTNYAISQCQSFAKTKCLPQLKPYISSGQLYSTTLLANDHTELTMTFYSGQNYRIAVCAQKSLGEISFRLKDGDNNIIFSNKGYGNFWDFTVQSTQELTIEVITPPGDPNATLDNSGCVAILVGFKQ